MILSINQLLQDLRLERDDFRMELIRRAAPPGTVVGAVGVIVLVLANPFSRASTLSMDENFTPVAPGADRGRRPRQRART